MNKKQSSKSLLNSDKKLNYNALEPSSNELTCARWKVNLGRWFVRLVMQNQMTHFWIHFFSSSSSLQFNDSFNMQFLMVMEFTCSSDLIMYFIMKRRKLLRLCEQVIWRKEKNTAITCTENIISDYMREFDHFPSYKRI